MESLAFSAGGSWVRDGDAHVVRRRVCDDRNENVVGGHDRRRKRCGVLLRAATAASGGGAVRKYLEKLIRLEDLSSEEMRTAFDVALDDGNAEELAAMLVLLAAKKETPEEIGAVATAMRARMVRVDGCGDGENDALVDIVGTGGDGADTINISTAASVVAAACGARVAKHGNRSVSSKCGSADVLETLGVQLELDAAGVARCVRDARIGFMFAPMFHPAMARVAPVRRALRVRTMFNIMGPLLNPAGARRGVIGVYSPEYCGTMARALKQLGAEHVLVVNTNGIDELSTTGVAHVAELTPQGEIREWQLDAAAELGMPRAELEQLRGGDASENAAILRELFAGERPGPMQDAVALNAAAGLYVAGVCESIEHGVAVAHESMKSGAPRKTLDAWVSASNAGHSS